MNFLVNDLVYRQLGMSRIIKFDEKHQKTLSAFYFSLFLRFLVVIMLPTFVLRFGRCLGGPGADFGAPGGGPGGGFGAPGGGFSDSRNSGKPLLLLRFKKHPRSTKSPPGPPKPTKT